MLSSRTHFLLLLHCCLQRLSDGKDALQLLWLSKQALEVNKQKDQQLVEAARAVNLDLQATYQALLKQQLGSQPLLQAEEKANMALQTQVQHIEQGSLLLYQV